MPKIKHFATPVRCILISTATLSTSIALLCIPKTISVVWSTIIGALIPVLMYLESLLFDPVVSEKEKLIELCRAHNYNLLKTDIAIKFFYYKEKPREVWLWLCETQPNAPEWESVRKMKYRMKKDLFKDVV